MKICLPTPLARASCATFIVAVRELSDDGVMSDRLNYFTDSQLLRLKALDYVRAIGCQVTAIAEQMESGPSLACPSRTTAMSRTRHRALVAPFSRRVCLPFGKCVRPGIVPHGWRQPIFLCLTVRSSFSPRIPRSLGTEWPDSHRNPWTVVTKSSEARAWADDGLNYERLPAACKIPGSIRSDC
jgi:hypothetical protein